MEPERNIYNNILKITIQIETCTYAACIEYNATYYIQKNMREKSFYAYVIWKMTFFQIIILCCIVCAFACACMCVCV